MRWWLADESVLVWRYLLPGPGAGSLILFLSNLICYSNQLPRNAMQKFDLSPRCIEWFIAFYAHAAEQTHITWRTIVFFLLRLLSRNKRTNTNQLKFNCSLLINVLFCYGTKEEAKAERPPGLRQETCYFLKCLPVFVCFKTGHCTGIVPLFFGKHHMHLPPHIIFR